MRRYTMYVVLAVLTISALFVPMSAAAPKAGADLAITKVADRATAHVGDSVTYTISLTNHGPKRATDVLLGEGAPDQLGVTAYDCGVGTPVQQGAFTCRYDRINKGQTVTATFVATVTLDASPGMTVTNLAEAYFEACPDRSCGDPDYSNNTGTAAITIIP
jgi:uncharacterized repeat protein (TIGR01451 family)